MVYATPATRATGYVILATNWNEFVENFTEMAPDLFTANGDIYIASGANVGVKLAAFTSSTGVLKHENGGLEFDASAVTTGDGLYGQSSGVVGIETAMTQAQAEAGTETQVRPVTALRIKQAIDALGTAHTLANLTTTLLDSSDTVGANTELNKSLGALTNADHIILWDIRRAGSATLVVVGSHVTTGEAVSAQTHSFIRRASDGSAQSILALINGSTESRVIDALVVEVDT